MSSSFLFNFSCNLNRTTLPSPMYARNDFSIWSVLKNCIGKELSKITMPVVFNEPLSFLQRMTEYMEYAKLLRIASEQDDPLERMKYVAGTSIYLHIQSDRKDIIRIVDDTRILFKLSYCLKWCSHVNHQSAGNWIAYIHSIPITIYVRIFSCLCSFL